jgi:hypothetical protein
MPFPNSYLNNSSVLVALITVSLVKIPIQMVALLFCDVL